MAKQDPFANLIYKYLLSPSGYDLIGNKAITGRIYNQPTPQPPTTDYFTPYNKAVDEALVKAYERALNLGKSLMPKEDYLEKRKWNVLAGVLGSLLAGWLGSKTAEKQGLSPVGGAATALSAFSKVPLSEIQQAQAIQMAQQKAQSQLINNLFQGLLGMITKQPQLTTDMARTAITATQREKEAQLNIGAKKEALNKTLGFKRWQTEMTEKGKTRRTKMQIISNKELLKKRYEFEEKLAQERRAFQEKLQRAKSSENEKKRLTNLYTSLLNIKQRLLTAQTPQDLMTAVPYLMQSKDGAEIAKSLIDNTVNGQDLDEYRQKMLKEIDYRIKAIEDQLGNIGAKEFKQANLFEDVDKFNELFGE